MAPRRSFQRIGALVACGATAVQAAAQSYQLSEEYTADNFFDKFDFFVSTYTSGDSWDATHGYVQYRSQAEAEALGLISTTSSGAVYIGPDTTSTYNASGTGRDSVRMTSKAMYNQGLMIAEFSHMPAQACGAWPAFWSYGSPWLTMGEIDYYEGWDLQGHNRMAMHTNGSLSGACTLTSSGTTGTILTESCVNDEEETGCGVEDDSGVWASSTGATFAMLWTDEAIKVWSWVPSSVPADVTAGAPVPSASGWGEPTMMVEQDNCDLASSFANQQLVFNIDFCGDTAGAPTFWDVSCSALSDTCASYVAENPTAFANTYFEIEGIKYYELGVAATTAVSATQAATQAAATTSAAAAVVTLSTSTLSTSSNSAGLMGGVGSLLESTLGATATSEAAAIVTTSHSHSTGYVYATSVATDDQGSETTVVVTVDTTICPVTAAEASQSSVAAAAASASSAAIVDAQTTTTSPPAASATGGLSAPAAVSSAGTATSESSPVEETSSAVVSSPSGQATSSALNHPNVSTSMRTLTISIPASAISSAAATQATSSESKSKSKAAAASASSATPSIDSSSTEIISLSLYTSATAIVTASASATSGLSTEVISSTTDFGGDDALATATASPTSVSLDWLTAAATGIYSYNATASGVASSTGGASAAKATDTCSGLDCIVVSSSAGRNWQGDASMLALVVFAGIVLLV
ncbi:concanavalin A-like lectin/glucanase domain-containing protein [Coniella lustricola]|uniref:Concanavalin A-like lectin/glucanase domain-containing protein n=1 Tax=Coniella lustricola TaxID=2025994 RepID=A0A2T3AAB1_9PEZI|nr:concanavalin A-like lectin/glucanase domain-containing protein [Coniella lustricola]